MKKSIISVIVTLALTMSLLLSKHITEAVVSSASFAILKVIPSLFFIMVISKIASRAGVCDLFYPLIKPLTRFLHLSKSESSCFLIGNLCGFPCGAMLCSDEVCDGRTPRDNAPSLAALSNNISAPFMISFVGSALFGSVSIGAALYVIQLLSAVTVGAFARRKLPFNNEDETLIQKNTPAVETFCSSVSESALSCISIAAFITVFGTVNFLISDASEYFRIPGTASALIKAFFEISEGCRSASSLGPAAAFAVISFGASFSGLCVIFQSASHLIRSKISVSRYVFYKLLQGCISSLMSFLIFELFDFSLNTGIQVDHPSPRILPFLSAVVCILFLMITIKRLFSNKA